MDVVKGLLASEGQSTSVMNESSFWIVIREREKLNCPNASPRLLCAKYSLVIKSSRG